MDTNSARKGTNSAVRSQEIDRTANYSLTKNIKFQLGYRHFFSGDYLVDTGAHSDADFSYAMTTFSF